jgi:predicted transcriptional regulator
MKESSVFTKYRRHHNLTIGDLARLLNVKLSEVMKVEKGINEGSEELWGKFSLLILNNR